MQDTPPVSLGTIIKRSSTPDAVSKVGAWMNAVPLEVTEEDPTSNDPDPSNPPVAPETTRYRVASRNRECMDYVDDIRDPFTETHNLLSHNTSSGRSFGRNEEAI
ncbi:hypothetical protein M407DRAFT_120839 [Tulasnella calospora MUT 4182]|uniref:Uncharacterized protein n=1 Tax=Tulasnella calospora MUT 4182 TaxID=1051891 RepID=A0A0C3LL32_9AGAM|nr:hypothetical protein M407DRAFT_120839 [Tulasnella calospora MUT 4182]